MIVPDLRGFSQSDKHLQDPAIAYSAAAQARSVLGLLDELGVANPVIAGYDIGSRITQTIANTASARLRSIVICPPLPGAGQRVLSPDAQREYWYQSFHSTTGSLIFSAAPCCAYCRGSVTSYLWRRLKCSSRQSMARSGDQSSAGVGVRLRATSPGCGEPIDRARGV
ncbi:MAG TPA: alpha/beta hydrolase [Candidatus Dormibacteraeota bacterium]|nr:alpha/beta hydrolase [Candidatus Dormibacteraeota bacterium]